MDNHAEAYREEARELLVDLESALLELEENPDDLELIGRAFRDMHTIKGSGAMFGFDEVAAFTHEIETVLDLVRGGKIPVGRELLDGCLAAMDHIKQMIEGEAVPAEDSETILASFRRMLDEAGCGVDIEPADAASESSAGADLLVTYHIRFRPAADLFTTGTNPLLLLDELRSLGECNVTAHTNSIPSLKELDPESCYLFWDVVLTTDRGSHAIRDVFIFVEDDCDLEIRTIDEPGDSAQEEETDYKKLGELLVERGDLQRGDLDRVLTERKPIGEELVEAGAVPPSAVDAALKEQERVRGLREKRREAGVASSVRVPADKLDMLVDLVSELVTVQAHLSQSSTSRQDPELQSISEQVEQLTADLRDTAMGIRMVPIGATFNRFKRLVRDLSRELGKELVMVTEGGETELDKTVIERLNDPLVHIIRNCIDHGIGTPAQREAAGKPSQGVVQLSAAHSGANVLIRISDDGGGLDAAAIRAKAVEKGLIPADADLCEAEIFELILAPGFSTADHVSDVSGRGVGMDVVRRNIEALRGSLDIRSQPGVGTTITLKLPLTLAIIDGLLVEIHETRFVLPLSTVEECMELTQEDIAKAHGRHIINVRGELVPYVVLRDLFRTGGEIPQIEQVVVTETDGRRLGFVVDNIIGEHQTVIKSLGKMYQDARGFSGATILPDGTVALILDVHKIAETAQHEERNAA